MQTHIELEPNKVDVCWIQKFEKKCLSLEIFGHLSTENALSATSRWREEIHALESGEKANIICNCLKMTGYDTDARKHWQQTISDLKSRIRCMWIITDNNLFRMAARTMGLLTKFQIKTAKSESEICKD